MAVKKVIEIDLQSNAGTGLEAINTEINKVAESSKSLKTQLREAQLEVATLSDKFGATSKEAVNAAKKAGELKDKIGDAKALTDAFNPDAKFKALTSSLGGVASGFAAYQGALGLVGVESKQLEEQLLKVQSAMAISQGLQGIGESVDSFKQLGAVIKNTSVAQKVLTATTAAYTFVTEASTTGLKLFRLALVSTGIGAIVVGLGLLVANFDKVKKAVLNVVPGLANVGEVIGNIVNAVTDFVGATSEADRALDKLKDNADKTLSINKKFMQEHGDQVDAYTKKKIDAKNAYAEAVKEDGADQVALAKRLNRELAEIEFSRGDEKRKIQKDANEKASANKKADNEKLKKEAEDEAKKLKDEKDKAVISEAEAYRNQLEAVQKVEADAKKANEDALLTEQQLAIKNENLAYQTKKANAIKFGQDTEEIERQHWNTLNDINLTAQQKQYEDDKLSAEKRLAVEQAYQDAKRNALDTGLGILQQFAGKNKALALTILAIQKGLAIADIVVGASKAISAASSALASTPAVIGVVPNPMYAIQAAATVKGIATTKITAATSIASILAAGIGQASSIKGGGGGGGSTGGGGGGSVAPAPQFNVVGNTGVNQIASSLGQPQPIQAYVVAGAVTTGQALNRNIISNASMG